MAAEVDTPNKGYGAAKRQILDAATSLFVQDGFKATSVKAIANRVGITPPALYWHFPSKRELFLASMEDLLQTFVDSVQSRLTAEDPINRLRQFACAHVMWKLEQSDAAGTYTNSIGMREIVRNMPPEHRRVFVDLERLHMNTLRSILEDGVHDRLFTVPDIRVTAFAILTMCEYVQSWYDPMGELAPADVADHFGKLVLGMVHADEAAAPDAGTTRRRRASSGD